MLKQAEILRANYLFDVIITTMVCFNVLPKKLTAEELAVRIKLLNLSPERAEFLLACPVREIGKSIENSKGYTEACIAQVKESARLGISFRDTAKMMELKEDNLNIIAKHYKITFPRVTTAKRCNRSSSPCLMTPLTDEEIENDRIESMTFYIS